MSVSTELRSIPSDHEMMVYNTMAKSAVESKMYKGIGDQAGVMMIMLAARELNIPPMSALNGGLNIINGKVEISARMMNALIRRAGHSISIKESSESSCTVFGKRGDTGDTASCSYTITEAQRAGLVRPNSPWTKCPKDMLFARAMSRLSRQLFADVVGIGYVEGEIKEKDSMTVVPVDVPYQEETPVDDESAIKNSLFSLINPDDHNTLEAYISTVMKHFGWTRTQTMKELLKDEQMFLTKFEIWKNKVSK